MYILEQGQADSSTHVSLPSLARSPEFFHSWDVNHSEVDNICLLNGEMTVSQLCFHSFDNALFSLVTSSQRGKGLRSRFWLPHSHKTSVAKSSPQVSALPRQGSAFITY